MGIKQLFFASAAILTSIAAYAQPTPYIPTSKKIYNQGVYPRQKNTKPWNGRQPGNYNIRFKIKGVKPGDTVYIADHYLDGKYLRDTTVVDKKGVANFTGTQKLQRGMYLFVFPKMADYFEFIMDDDQDFAVTSEIPFGEESFMAKLKIEGSEENTAFMIFKSETMQMSIDLNKLEEQSKTDTLPEQKKAIDKKKRAIYELRENYNKNYIKKYPSHLLSRFLYAMDDVEVSEEMPLLPDGTRDSAAPARNYKLHYWDHVDFNEDGLVRMPYNIMKQKLSFYFDKLVWPEVDSLIKECDMLIEKSKNSVDLEQFIITTLLRRFEASNIMGQDAVAVHIAMNTYCNNRCWWTDSATVANVCSLAVKKSPTLIGKFAPPVELLTQDSVWVNTANIQAPYTIMIFWDPTCGHCREVMPKLAKIYENNKSKGWKVIALSSSDKKAEWIKYLQEHPEMSGFTHLLRGYVKDDFWANQLSAYFIYASPTIFVLDKSKKILANRIDVEKIEGFIEHVEKVNAKKAKG